MGETTIHPHAMFKGPRCSATVYEMIETVTLSQEAVATINTDSQALRATGQVGHHDVTRKQKGRKSSDKIGGTTARDTRCCESDL